jgi:hypothetical protein
MTDAGSQGARVLRVCKRRKSAAEHGVRPFSCRAFFFAFVLAWLKVEAYDCAVLIVHQS